MAQESHTSVEVFEAACRLLVDPIEYARRLVMNFAPYPADVVVRLSFAPSGTPPDYFVSEVMDESGLSPLAAYSGKTHRDLAFKKMDEPQHWSAVSVTKKEVSQMLGRLRGFVPKSNVPVVAKRKKK